jgi:hypothetical protein
MRKFLQWNEYLNDKGKVESGTTDIHGDKTTPMKSPNSPPGTQGHKPYCASDGKTIKHGKEKGLGDDGDKDLIFNFKPNEDGKAPAKIPTAEQYNLISTFRQALLKDPTLLEAFVRDLKRNGMLGQVVAELTDHNETYKHLAEVMGSKYGEKVCDKLARAIYTEGTSPPFSEAKPDDEIDDEIADPLMNGESEEEGLEGMDDEEITMPSEDGAPEEMGGEHADPNKARALFNFHRSMMKFM